MLLDIYANLWLKILKFGGVKKIWQLFDISKILKNWHFSAQQMANQWLIQKSKPGCVEYPGVHLWTDSWSNQSMPSTLQAVANVCKNGHFAFYVPLDPLSVLHPPKMVPLYSLGTCPPTNPKTLWCPIVPSLRKNWFCEGIFFWQITQTALESPKIDICQNWPRRVLGDVINVIRCLESKLDKKMGSVPNCRKEIPACHAIRWFT